MSLSAAELAAVVAELAPRLVGSTVGKVRDAAALTTLLEIGRAAGLHFATISRIVREIEKTS